MADDTVSTLANLIDTVEDGRQGFSDVADKLAEDDHDDAAARMRELSAQRERFADELKQAATRHGTQLEPEGSTAASLHRAWTTLKDALTGSAAGPVVSAAVTGEEHAISQYEDALDGDALQGDDRETVEGQLEEIRSVRDELEQLADRL